MWIGDPYDDGHFNGTAFFIDEHTLVTAKHVVVNRNGEKYENIFLSDTPDGGITPIVSVKLCERDIAILKVKKAFKINKNNMVFSNELSVGDNVNVVGFYDKNSSQKSYENRVSGYQNNEHTYELQNHLTNGLSGSPVLLDGKIVGIAKAINSSKNLTYVIPIEEVCVDIEYIEQEEEPKEEKTKNFSTFMVSFFAPLLIPTIIILIILTWSFKAMYNNVEISAVASFLIVVSLIIAKVFIVIKSKIKGSYEKD